MGRREALDRIHHELASRQIALRSVSTNASNLNDMAAAESSFDVVAMANRASTRVIETQRIELENLEAALARCKAGQYGICEVCGAEIHIPRLNALPYATRCICCQRTAEREAKDATASNGQ